MTTLLEQVREAFFAVLRERQRATTFSLSQFADAIRERIGQNRSEQIDNAILEVYARLFRTGIVVFGAFLDGQTSMSAFRLTEAGRALLADENQAPENPPGYLAGIPSLPEISPIARSYLTEALTVFASDHHRAAAVLLGAVVEVTVFDLRDAFVAKLKERGESPTKRLEDPSASAKEVYDVLSTTLRQYPMPSDLTETFEAHWDSFLSDIRLSRNAAGHPKSLEPVTRDDVRAGFLQLRSVLKIADRMHAWIAAGLKE